MNGLLTPRQMLVSSLLYGKGEARGPRFPSLLDSADVLDKIQVPGLGPVMGGMTNVMRKMAWDEKPSYLENAFAAMDVPGSPTSLMDNLIPAGAIGATSFKGLSSGIRKRVSVFDILDKSQLDHPVKRAVALNDELMKRGRSPEEASRLTSELLGGAGQPGVPSIGEEVHAPWEVVQMAFDEGSFGGMRGIQDELNYFASRTDIPAIERRLYKKIADNPRLMVKLRSQLNDISYNGIRQSEADDIRDKLADMGHSIVDSDGTQELWMVDITGNYAKDPSGHLSYDWKPIPNKSEAKRLMDRRNSFLSGRAYGKDVGYVQMIEDLLLE